MAASVRSSFSASAISVSAKEIGSVAHCARAPQEKERAHLHGWALNDDQTTLFPLGRRRKLALGNQNAQEAQSQESQSKPTVRNASASINFERRTNELERRLEIRLDRV